MISNITSDIVVALLVLGVIIVIHELGHFLVAKFFKIKVEVFSVGFGPRLFGFRRGETDYRISAFPLGGYVKMAGENPGDNVTGAENEFQSKPRWQRFLVASAGPVMNILLAVVLMTGLFMYGSDVPEFLNDQAMIGVVEAGSPAAQAGIQPGDRVLAIDDKQNPNWQEIESRVLINPGRSLPLVIDRNGQRIETTVTPVRRDRTETGYVGMAPRIRVVVRRVWPGYPAEAAGLQAGDEILFVDEIDLRTVGHSIQEVMQEIDKTTFPITVLRRSAVVLDADAPSNAALYGDNPAAAGETKVLEVTPIVQDGRKMIGIDIPLPTVTIKLGFVDAFKKSVDTNIENASLIFQVLGKLFKREASLKTLDGPIGIVRVSGQAFDLGFATLVSLMAVISLNLGLINALPIPILDGGVMLMLLVESVMGRDLSLPVKEKIVQVSFVFLLMLTVFVLYNDVLKLLPPSQPAP